MTKSAAKIGSKRDWNYIMLLVGGFLDDIAVVLTGKLFGLQVQIVQENNNTQRLYDATEAPTEELGAPRPLGQHSLLNRPRCAHFEALISKVRSVAHESVLFFFVCRTMYHIYSSEYSIPLSHTSLLTRQA